MLSLKSVSKLKLNHKSTTFSVVSLVSFIKLKSIKEKVLAESSIFLAVKYLPRTKFELLPCPAVLEPGNLVLVPLSKQVSKQNVFFALKNKHWSGNWKNVFPHFKAFWVFRVVILKLWTEVLYHDTECKCWCYVHLQGKFPHNKKIFYT